MEETPPEIRATLGGFALAAANANVVMQLSRLPVGHGVARSTVETGRVDRHPLKRLRTTSAFLVISMFGTEAERAGLRTEINRAHRQVHSGPGGPVAYDAFDTGLQLWVAACLYRGTEDIYRLLYGSDPEPERHDVMYRFCRRFATTLQVPDAMWPSDRAAFDAYWDAGVAEIAMDDVTRPYLQGVAQLEFLTARFGAPGRRVAPLLAPGGRLLTLGFLSPPFRDELGLPWTPRDQHRFEVFIGRVAALTRRLPRPAREFPMNVYLADTRRRLASGRQVV